MAIPDRAAGNWAHLYLAGWPFRFTPKGSPNEVWADRKRLKEQIDRLLWDWSRHDPSSIHVMWADLGAGKSHTLRYIQRCSLADKSLRIMPIYAVMPKQLRSFTEVYQAILTGFDLPLLAQKFSMKYRESGSKESAARELFPSIPDAVSALLALQSDKETVRMIAAYWLRAGTELSKGQLDSIGVLRKLKTTDDAVAMLSGLFRIIVEPSSYRRVVVMLDEFQRIGEFKRAVGEGINRGLQTLYDATPDGLTLVLSFGVGAESFVRPLLSPEILDREHRPGLTVPLFSRKEVLEFAAELLATFRLEGAPSSWFPISSAQAELIAATLTSRGPATPRAVMKGFESVFKDADFRITRGMKLDWSNRDLATMVQAAVQGLALEAD
ncbi:MAG: hypothetical protein EXR78_09750 [Deltaproteobacteria bacterium]|nr:hypothetical protein [Deltaproteobacteria bacterium]